MPAVTGVTAQAVSSSAINVQWVYSKPACGHIDGFVVTYSRDGGADMMLSVTDRSSRSVDITGLADMQGTYSISVKTMYQSVTSADSNTVMVNFITRKGTLHVTVCRHVCLFVCDMYVCVMCVVCVVCIHVCVVSGASPYNIAILCAI